MSVIKNPKRTRYNDSSLKSLKRNIFFSLALKPFVVLIFLIMICGCTTLPAVPENMGNGGLTILVDDPHVLSLVQNLTGEYENQTGVSVTIKQISAGSGTNVTSLPPGDLLVGGISRIPVYASSGQLEPLNTILNTSSTANWTVLERPSLNMAGEYPERSGTIYSLPLDQDALGIVYLADLVDNPDESAKFCATYNYPIGVPGNYEELTDIAKFFSSNVSHRSGIGFAGLEGTDPISSPWMGLLSSYGSGIYDPSSGKAAGTWNSSRTIAAMSMMRNLSRYEPNGAEKWNDTDVADAISSGSIVMAITWFSQFPKIQSAAEEQNLSLGFMPLPGEITSEGSFRAITVRVDSIALLKDGSREKALAFLNWFYSPEVQLSFARSGHQPALLTVLDSYPYMNMNLYNRAFPESMRVGVSGEKGEYADAVRLVCEETVNTILSPDGNESPEEVMRVLNASAALIDFIRKNGSSS